MLPFELSNIVKHPSTCEESKYFFSPLSIFALLTEHDVKPEMQNKKINGESVFIKKVACICNYLAKRYAAVAQRDS